MKKIILLFILIFSIVKINAQTNDLKHRPAINIGSSFIGLNTNMWVQGSLVNDAFASPVPVISYTYMLEDKIGFGGSVSYQFFNFDLLPLNSHSSALKMNINRLNASIFGNFYFANQQNFDIYLGGRFGRTFWFGNVTFDELYNYLSHILPSFVSDNIVNEIVPSDIKFFKSFFSYQVYLGGDIFFTDNIGLKIETAVGSPYWALAGLSFKF